MTNKEKYIELCKKEDSIPIFSKYWWLDAVCGDAWDVCIVEKDGEIVASLPYCLSKNRFGMNIISHPALTPILGPWLKNYEAKYVTIISNEKTYLSALIDQLPKYAHFEQTWHHTQLNWLPFFWKGFQQTTRYTYRLSNLTDLKESWDCFADNIRREIRKAENRFNVTVRTDLTVNDFLKLNAKTFNRQGKNVPYNESFILRLDEACNSKESRRIFIAEDAEGKHHAGVYIVWDKQSAYYLMGGGDPELRSSGATSLCMWEAIKFCSTVTKEFDFEGSMIEPIERFFRAFGAVQTPYFSISRTPSKLINTRVFLSKIFQN